MSLNDNGTTFTPMSPDLVADIEVTRAQNRNYASADGFHRLAKKDNTFPLVLRYKPKSERLYRRAVEEFERVKALRDEFPKEPISTPNPKKPSHLPRRRRNPVEHALACSFPARSAPTTRRRTRSPTSSRMSPKPQA
jgi:hypothetical protein